MNDLSQLISEPTRIPDNSVDKANTLDLFLTSNQDIYSKPYSRFSLGTSDNCLITLHHNFVSHQDRSSSSQKVFHYSKADWDSLQHFFTAYPWYCGLSNDPSLFATFITNTIQLLMDPFIPSYHKPGKKSSPSGSIHNVQMLSNIKNCFKQWKLHQTPHSKALSVQARNLCSKTINHAKSSFVKRINNKIASCQTGSCSFWSLAKIVSQNFCHSSFPPLKTTLAHLRALHPLKLTFSHQTLLRNLILMTTAPLYPTSTIKMPPIKFSTHKVWKVLLQLNTSKSSGPDVITAIVLKSCAPKLAPVLNKLFQLSYNLGIFPSPWKLAHVLPIPKKVTNVTLQTITLLQ